MTSEQARELLDGIDTFTLIGLRDRALIGMMMYAFARRRRRCHAGRGLLRHWQALVGASA
jgi:hypothetical protein